MAGLSPLLSALALLLGSAAGVRNVVKRDKVACSDSQSACQYWTEQGYCLESSQYHTWMQRNCCASCNPGPAPTPAPTPPPTPLPPGACGFVNQPVEVSSGREGYRAFIYTEPFRADFWVDGNLRRDTAWAQYTQWLTETMARNFGDVDPFDQIALLIRQRDVFGSFDYDTFKWDVMINGTVGAITEANCIESALWAKQNELHPLSDNESEFGAYILLNSDNTTVKVYQQTGPTPSVPGMSWATGRVESDLDNGWKLLTFLHNHPFFADQPGGRDCAGTCSPSSPDLRAFATGVMTQAQEFWITNGHDSFRFANSELYKFTPPATAAGAFGARSVQREYPEGPLDLLLGGKS